MDSTSYRLAIELRNALLVELRQHHAFLAYEHIQAAITALDTKAEQLPPPEDVVAAEKDGRKGFRAGSQSEAILTGSTIYLREKKARAKSAELLKALTAKGVTIGGRRPRSTLASYLSHSALFDNKPGEGYGLVEWSRPKTEPPSSGELLGVPKANGSSPLSP